MKFAYIVKGLTDADTVTIVVCGDMEKAQNVVEEINAYIETKPENFASYSEAAKWRNGIPYDAEEYDHYEFEEVRML